MSTFKEFNSRSDKDLDTFKSYALEFPRSNLANRVLQLDSLEDLDQLKPKFKDLSEYLSNSDISPQERKILHLISSDSIDPAKVGMCKEGHLRKTYDNSNDKLLDGGTVIKITGDLENNPEILNQILKVLGQYKK